MDSNGSEYPGQYDATMTLPYQKSGKPDWAISKPDGELADIISSFKKTADQEDTVPNGLLTFEFEGRNSMISDLSSLHSYGSEQSLNLDNLPEQVKKQFRWNLFLPELQKKKPGLAEIIYSCSY